MSIASTHIRESRSLNWKLWLLASIGGGAAGMALAGLLGFSALIAPLLGGLCASAVQWLVLRSMLGTARLWLLVTGFALGAGYLAAGLAVVASLGVLSWLDLFAVGSSGAAVAARGATVGLLGGVVVGSIVGAAQGRLRQYHVGRSSLWLWSNVVGWALGSAIQAALVGLWIADGTRWRSVVALARLDGADMRVQLMLVLGVAGALGWLVIGGVIGLALNRFFSYPEEGNAA